MFARPNAFTLIELLVVISIIVLLLSLLAPAMDRAIHRAELLVCASNQRVMSQGLIVYATENKRTYPDRSMTSATTVDMKRRFGTNGDVRPLLIPLFPLKLMNDPFVSDFVDFDIDATVQSINVKSSYSLVWGADWKRGSAMRKLGQKNTWTDSNDRTYRLNILIADQDYNNQGTQWWSSHQDGNGLLQLYRRQNEAAGEGIITMSFYLGNGSSASPPGKQDFNYALDDGSIRTMENVQWIWDSSVGTFVPAEGFIDVPEDIVGSRNYPVYRQQLPY